MKKFIKHVSCELGDHLLDYLILITAGVFFIVFLQSFSSNRILMFVTLTAFCSFYIIWGITHHAKSQTLHLKNMIEYILIAFTILFIVRLILL